jgi:PTH1 family peptidyl-tRNA hydrolase
MRLVIGLGNPGAEYDWTPHNVGFHVLDHLALHEGLIFEDAATSRAVPGGLDGPRDFHFARSFEPDGMLVKPTTWMNRSGEAVAPLARALLGAPDTEPELDRLLVVYDDLDLPLGKLRIRPHGSSGGQRGMQSIVDELGDDRFPRLRVGVGPARTDAARHVLTPFDPEQRQIAESRAAEAAQAILFWLCEGDIEKCMTRFHSRWTEELT